MTKTALGYCQPSSDTLSQIGVATGVWTPDGAGGGTLVVNVPQGLECHTPPSDDTDPTYSVSMLLVRAFCGTKYSVSVTGNGNGYASTIVYVYDGAGTLKLQMQPESGGTTCADAVPLNVVDGTNPVDVTSQGCGDEGIQIFVAGSRAFSQAHEITVTVTAL
jgi:hypothetical protein